VYTSRRHPKLAHGLQALAAQVAWSNKRLLVVAITSHIAEGSYAYRASKAALNAVMRGLIFGKSAKVWVGSSAAL
jgi:NAD(P)-dependent dehydrogenase (short-subunit alcohol dehydrogenase family)